MAWLIYSSDISTDTQTLVSLLRPSMTSAAVAKYVEQTYVDKYASVEEKIAYKKHPASWPYPAKVQQPTNTITCGFGPIYIGIHCYKLEHKHSMFIGYYRFIKKLVDFVPTEIVEAKIEVQAI